jgi:hypothetical protein
MATANLNAYGNTFPIHLNVVTADSHVGEIERSIRTVKEHLRSSVHGLPFKRLIRTGILSEMGVTGQAHVRRPDKLA